MTSKIINQNDPRVKKTKSQFMKTFKELVFVYDDYMGITVKELCDKAGLNRKTFYLHYKQIDDLFLELQDEMIEEFYNAIRGVDVFNDVESVVKAYFDLNESNMIYQKLCLSPHYLYTKELIRKRGTAFYNEKEKKDNTNNIVIYDYIRAFYYYVGFIFYSKWVRSNRSIPKEEIIKLAANLIKNGLSSMQVAL